MWSRIRGLLGRARRNVARQARRHYVERRLKTDPGLHTLPGARKSILFFSPEAGFKASSIIQSVLARTLKESGHAVIMARCFRLFDRCPVMDLQSLPYDVTSKGKEQTCLDCVATSFDMFDSYGLEPLDLRSFLTPELESKFAGACKSLPADLTTFAYESVPFGKLCLHDLVLGTKFSEIDQIGEKFRGAWEAYVKTSLLSYLLVDRICEQFPISQVLYVNNYSLQFGAHFAARKHNLPAYSLYLAPHQGVDYGRYVVLPELIWPSLFRQGHAWPKWRNLALSENQVRQVGNDVLVRLGAVSSHIYSPPKNVHVKDIRVELGLATNKKLVVAYTSSLDELLALGALKESIGLAPNKLRQPFVDQIDWLQQVIDFIGTRDDLQLVVRIHPREGANKRDSISAQNLTRLRKAFGHDVPNCRIVWPAEPISSYDLGEAADLVLTSGSTIGLELARLGAPVLTSASGETPSPHDDFREFCETPKAYFDKFCELLDREASLETIARAFRWYNLFHLGTSVDLIDLVPQHDSVELPQFKMPAEAETIERIIVGGKHPLDLNYERIRQAQMADSIQQEFTAIKAELRRVIHFFHTGEDSRETPRLLLVSKSGSHSNGGGPESTQSPVRTISVAGNHTRYSANGKVYSRYSPLCARLALLCGEASDAPAQVAVSLTGAVV